jgi:hypothetical protein
MRSPSSETRVTAEPCSLRNQPVSDAGNDAQRIGGAVGGALFKVDLAAAHLVRQVRDTDHSIKRGLRVCVERSGLHLDARDARCGMPIERLLGFAERRVSRPRDTYRDDDHEIVEIAGQVRLRAGRRLSKARRAGSASTGSDAGMTGRNLVP